MRKMVEHPKGKFELFFVPGAWEVSTILSPYGNLSVADAFIPFGGRTTS
jgi:hypothetical protein